MGNLGSFQSFVAFGANARSARDQPICRLRDTRDLPLEPIQLTQRIPDDTKVVLAQSFSTEPGQAFKIHLELALIVRDRSGARPPYPRSWDRVGR